MSDDFQTATSDHEVESLGKAPETRSFFGDAYPQVAGFAELLSSEGELRGLIGPREVGRLWSRHIFNSAAVAPFLPDEGLIVDVGSGAGLPGVVLAAMKPDAQIVLVEPMERRCTWLTWVADQLALDNIDVRRGRAEEFHGAFEADAVTARAVAGLDKLARITLPLLRSGGQLVALKGRNAASEVAAATKVVRRLGGATPEVIVASTIDGVDDTVVVRIVRTSVKGA